MGEFYNRSIYKELDFGLNKIIKVTARRDRGSPKQSWDPKSMRSDTKANYAQALSGPIKA